MQRLIPLLLAALAGHAVAEAPAADLPGIARLTFGAAVESTVLGTLRGGADTTVNDMRLHGTTAANTAQNVATGSNAVSGGSFANLSGIPIVIQNTGANVLIQNAVILNLQMN